MTLVASVAYSLQAPVLAQTTDFVMLPPLGVENKFGSDSFGTNGASGNGDMPVNAAGDTMGSNSIFELRPHCDSVDYRAAFSLPPKEGIMPVMDSECPQYDVKDPQTRQTATLKEGDALDWDLVIHNPTNQPVQRFRAWIAYDPTVLEGELIEIAKAFPTPTPGETDFSQADGMIKVSASADTPQTGAKMIVARIRLHTLSTAQSSVPVTFYDATGRADSHTAIFVRNGTQDTNIATAVPGSVVVRVTPSSGSAQSTSASASATVTTSSTATSTAVPSSAAASAPSNNAGIFALLQVQNLRVTTEGGSVFLAWNKLPSADLAGYNLYYGTISGQYVQKRGIDKNATSMTIRALPEGVTYYFAIRGVDADNRETDFSQEVGISVGNPATSTAPLSASAIERAPSTPRTGGNVSGETGMASTVALFLFLSAAIGTGLAFRRQLSAKV